MISRITKVQIVEYNIDTNQCSDETGFRKQVSSTTGPKFCERARARACVRLLACVYYIHIICYMEREGVGGGGGGGDRERK